MRIQTPVSLEHGFVEVVLDLLENRYQDVGVYRQEQGGTEHITEPYRQRWTLEDPCPRCAKACLEQEEGGERMFWD